jgi:MFS transporter, DHA2 family, methylenomycin A resistance protein
MESRPSKFFTLAAMSLGYGVVQLDLTIVNVALKTIETAFGGGVADLEWVVNAYTLVFAALILSAGAAADRCGARKMFVAGFLVFICASLACGLSPRLWVLIAARAAQGIGAAILVPCSLALLNHEFHEAAERNRAVGLWAAGASIAFAAGPVIGGVLIATIGWRGIFFINLPIGLLGCWLAARHTNETETTPGRGMDPVGQSIAILGLAALAASLIEGGRFGWTQPLILCGLGAAALAIMLFIAIERKTHSPMLPLGLFHSRTFSATLLIGLLINVAFYGLVFAISLYFQEVKGYSALQTGMAFLPMLAIVLVANLVAARLVRRFGVRSVMMLGQLILAGGCAGLVVADQNSPYAALGGQLLAAGFGIGLTVPPLTATALGSVPKDRSGIASGALISARQLGSVLGVSLFGSLIGSGDQFISGLRVAIAFSAALVLVGCGLALLATPVAKSGETRLLVSD